jgi:lysophospholipase L1-like esterase
LPDFARVNLQAIVEGVRASGARAWLLTIPPYEAPWGNSSIGMVEAFNNELRALAASTGARLIDVWPDLANSDGSWPVGYSCDPVHPAGPGAMVIATDVEAALAGD